MTQQVQSNKEANLSKQVAELQGRVQSLEQLLHQGKDVLTLEEAAKFMGIARSSLYKMTHEQTIPFYKPNGKMIFFEKSDLRHGYERTVCPLRRRFPRRQNASFSVSLPNRLEYGRIRGQAETGSRAGCPLGKDRAKAILHA